jgi:hypothetical protein
MCPMKKTVFLILFVLTSCQAFSGRTAPATMNVFTLNEQCPYVCWLGINPGKTTLEEAKTLLTASNQIDQKSVKIYGNSSIDFVWYDRGLDANLSRVEIEFRDELVSSIFFNNFPFSVNELVSLLGEPSQISITVLMGAHEDYFDYELYFPAQKVLLYSSPSGSQNGPQPDDDISRLVLNTEIYKYTLPAWAGKLQPWLGYGHVKDYLQGQELPPNFIMPEP